MAEGVSTMESELLRQRIRLYLYGELGLADRLEVERTRDEDADFRELFEEERAFLLSLNADGFGDGLDDMLEECRMDLALAVTQEERQPGRATLGTRLAMAFRGFRDSLAQHRMVWQPAAAVLLLCVGFLGGRSDLVPPFWTDATEGTLIVSEELPDDPQRALTGIENVSLNPEDDKIQIVFEERRVVTGASSDPFIRSMLLSSVEGSHAGARLSSLEALSGHAADIEVRRALLRRMVEDENPGIRLMALDAVRSQVAQPDVRQALVRALQSDPNSGMRVHAIQALGEHPDRDLAGPLQEFVQRESNPFVVEETQRILHSLGASVDHY